SAPYLGGGFGHFYAYAPTKIEYAIDRFAMETKRQLDVLDRRLGESKYLAGDDYTIADIALLGWVRNLVEYYEAAHLVAYDEVDDVHFWLDRGLARPAVQRGLKIPARG
ncbi:MAG TPA: glutathione S-transferase C-terminal domain-containing protein, partial [Sphingomicrobium sp.]|nr:glutathione S-transferase C-terminal domain-containing protein [Sphingomicrobium sp.]